MLFRSTSRLFHNHRSERALRGARLRRMIQVGRDRAEIVDANERGFIRSVLPGPAVVAVEVARRSQENLRGIQRLLATLGGAARDREQQHTEREAAQRRPLGTKQPW